VQIEKHQSCKQPPCAAVTSRDPRVASEHSTLFPMRLALARWMHGGDTPHVFAEAAIRQLPRAAWYAQTQRDFQAWLDAGGFHLPEAAATGAASHDGWPK